MAAELARLSGPKLGMGMSPAAGLFSKLGPQYMAMSSAGVENLRTSEGAEVGRFFLADALLATAGLAGVGAGV